MAAAPGRRPQTRPPAPLDAGPIGTPSKNRRLDCFRFASVIRIETNRNDGNAGTAATVGEKSESAFSLEFLHVFKGFLMVRLAGIEPTAFSSGG